METSARIPGRISLTEVTRALLDRRQHASETVTLRLNAKREVQPEVTAVAQDGESLESVGERASRTFLELCEKHCVFAPAEGGE